MEARVLQKMDWIKQRLIEICLGVQNVASWDNIQQEFLEKVNDCTKRFPSTNFGAFVKIVSQTPQVKPNLVDEVTNTLESLKLEKKSRNGDNIFDKTLTLKEEDYSKTCYSKKMKADIYFGGMFSSPKRFDRTSERITEKIVDQNQNILIEEYLNTERKMIKDQQEKKEVEEEK